MAAEESIQINDFLLSFKDFMDVATQNAPKKADPFFPHLLRAHFEAEPTKLPTITEEFEKADHPNIHQAITHLLEQDGWSAKLMGYTVSNDHIAVRFSHLLRNHYGSEPKEGPVEYINVSLHDDSTLACIQAGLYLIHHENEPLALLMRGSREWQTEITVEVMAHTKEKAEQLIAQLRAIMRKRNVYRGHVISLSIGQHRALSVQFHHLPTIVPKDIILPAGLLKRIERQTVEFSRLSEKLKAMGRHIKRGMLLYGPPGTGKTLTAMYLARQMPERTVLLLTGNSIGLLEQSCKLARLLQPATVILEDVDLIAEERTHQEIGCNALLFELLNQMDGLSDDADVLFLLTTNRADLLEPALAARPGRIDQAIEIPLPDHDCRLRLLELYGQGLNLHLERLSSLAGQTEGVSAAFIRELMRKAALFAAEAGDEPVVQDSHIDEALHELVYEGGELTKKLLGATRNILP